MVNNILSIAFVIFVFILFWDFTKKWNRENDILFWVNMGKSLLVAIILSIIVWLMSVELLEPIYAFMGALIVMYPADTLAYYLAKMIANRLASSAVSSLNLEFGRGSVLDTQRMKRRCHTDTL